MKTLKKKLLAILMVSAICLSVIPASASANDSLKSTQSNASAKSWRVPVGSFIQDYMTASWSDDRWQQELAEMKKAGMDMLIYSPSVMINGSSIKTNYPSKLFPNKNMYGSNDTVDACLRNCEKAGIKVLITLNQDPGKFWSFGWNISTTQPDVYKKYWQDNAVISNEVADELYGMYKNKYPDAFYGWYWVHEFWNYTICTNAYEGMKASDVTAADPSVYTDIIAEEGFNPVLDHLTQIDSSMPMLFSSFTNPNLATPEAVTQFWTAIVSKTHFRAGDIWAPMDGMGGSAITLDNLDTWTNVTATAAKANPNLHFWINNEEQIENPENDDEVSLINRTVQQITITSKYAENNVFFTWNHFFSPYVTLPGYEETYLQYVNTGAIEKNPPAAIDINSIKVSKHGDGYRVDWTAPTDDVGVAEYNVYKDGFLVDHLHTHRRDTGFNPVVPTFSFVQNTGKYEVEAIDFAGNVSPRTAFTVSDTPVTTTTTTETNTTGTTSITAKTDVTTTATTDVTPSETAVTVTQQTDSGTTQASSPATGSTIPTAAILFTVVTAGLCFAVKSKRK